MAIVVREGSHSLGERNLADGGQPRLRAESLAQVHLGREIERYARKESVGRSVLVSGHRGAGKTTLVLNAISDAQSRLAGTGYRAIPVRIPAPTLFLEEVEESRTDSAASRDVEQVLRRVTVSLAQAVLDEVHSAFLERAVRDPRAADCVELASRLRIDMERAPSLAGLRDIWSRAGLLDRGLFGAGAAQGAGFREILALWSTNEAWQVAGGKVRRTLGAEVKASNSASAKWDLATSGRDLLNPLLGLVSGALVGTSLLDEGGAWAAIGGTLAGLLTATGLNFSAARLVEYSQGQDFSFEPDTSVYSLSLLLPRLVAQLRDVGLAPVFVVDELDKVRHLRDKMQALVRHLKFLVTEDAFFCFLTDRSYFEYLRWRGRGAAYPEEYTYFTDRLYVVYRPHDLHSYLKSTLRSDSPGASREAYTDALDADVVRSVLLFRSRMHLIDLKRQLRALMDERSSLSLRPGVVRSGRMFRLETAYQIAVEWVLDQGILRVRTARDTWFLQLLYDALYYPAERWLEGLSELDLQPEVFYAYLYSRLDTEPFGGDVSSMREILSENDLQLLHDEMSRLVGYLRAPRTLVQEISAGGDGRQVGFPPAVLDALDSDEGILDPVEGHDHLFAWRFDPFGRRLIGEDISSQTGVVAEFVRQVAEFLRQTGGPVVDPRWMAEQALVLPSTPSWMGFQLALARLEAMADVSYPERGEHETVVRRYGDMLRDNLPCVGVAVVLGALAGRTVAGVSAADSVRPGLEELGELLAKPRPSEPTALLLRRLVDESSAILGLSLESAAICEAATPAALTEAVAGALAVIGARGVPTGPETTLASAWWTRWIDRFGCWLEEGRTRFEPGAVDLLYGERSGFSALFHWEDLGSPGLVGWSNGVVSALSGGALPSWGAVVGLEMLGLQVASVDALARLPAGPRPLPAEQLSRWASLITQRHGHHASPAPAVLVLCGSAEPIARWSCPSHYPAIALDLAGVEAMVAWFGSPAAMRKMLGLGRMVWVPDEPTVAKLIASPVLSAHLPESAAVTELVGLLGMPMLLVEPGLARKLHPGLGVVAVGEDADNTLERIFSA